MPKEQYDHQAIERKWQKRWKDEKTFSVSNGADSTPAFGHPSPEFKGGEEKKYVLDMFPYPSGDGLHVGHPEGYTATDIYSRYLRMNGAKVLHPMGWDAFGLPAENYAIKMGVHPAEVTAKNIANFKRQIQSLGFSYDWDREVNTTDPAYYKWTQWIFLQLFKRGLAYEKEAPIWWCPKDKTGLANEEVVNGKCDRCGTTVEKKMLKQWMLKITAYADRLLDGLNDVDWPEGIKTLQRNWIGKSEGAEVKFDIDETQKVKRVVILHGRNSTSKDYFYPKLRKDLVALGFEVQVPEMPEQNSEPDDEIQTDFVQQNCTLDTETVVVGHSFGGVVALRLLERGVKLNGVVLVATPYSGEFVDKVSRPTVTSAVKKGFKFSTIKKNSCYFEVLGGTNDSAVPLSDSNSFAEQLGVQVTHVTSIKPHFLGEEEPSIIKALIPSVTVFTTRPDTLFGATYLVLSPEHELVKQITTEKQKKVVEKYVKSVAAKSDLERTSLEKEKTGVFTGAYAINPVNNEKIPVWIADYVLSSYGTGAIMAVPAHDVRDYAFAKKFGLPIIKVVQPPSVMPKMMAASSGILGIQQSDIESDCWTDEGIMVHSGKFDGMDSADAREKIVATLQSKGLAQPKTQFKLRDWVFSRQRYWGEPIPLVHCESCKSEVESTKWVLNFYERAWRQIQSGQKVIETRALNPDEPDRYFGDLQEGEVIKAVLKGTAETMYLRVRKRYKLKNLQDLLNHQEVVRHIGDRGVAWTMEKLKKAYDFIPDYLDRIEKNGLVAWEIERVIPGVVPVPENQLPLELPKVDKYEPTGTGESPLAGITEWVNTECPACAERLKKPKYLIFDFDGVIGDTLQQNLQAKVNMGNAADLQEAIKQTNEYFSAKPDHVRGDHFDKEAEKKYHDWSRRFADEMVKLPYKLFTGFIEEIQKVSNAKIAVVSAGYDTYFKDPLEKSGLPYSHILAGNHHHSKETKIEDVCRAWGVDVQDVYYFTDTQADVYELENLLDRKKIIGCAWGFQGSKKLHEILPDDQVLEKFDDIHKLWKPSLAKRETNTMPQWAGSCWYYLRYCDPKNDKEFASAEAMKMWLPVDMYVGGAEHAVLHLLYARFWHKVLFDAGFIPKEVGDEPFKKLKNQGLILGPDGEKMSKSRGNVINPDEIVEKYGADTLRMYEMFMGPFEDAKPWDTNGILGVRRFLDKVWVQMSRSHDPQIQLAVDDEKGLAQKNNLETLLHQTIKKVTEDIESFRFNTAVSTLMIFLNQFAMYRSYDESKETKEIFLKLLSPFAPHIAEEIWHTYYPKLEKKEKLLCQMPWPIFDEAKISKAKVTIAIQVMGKLRGTLSMPTGATKEGIEAAAKAEPNVAKYLITEPKKVIFVQDKLINFVV